MKYVEFFSIDMEHAAYEDVQLPLVMDANEQTHVWIKNNGLIVKGKQNGIKVMAPSDLELNSQADKQLTFLIFPQTSDFGWCTDMSRLSGKEMFAFTNQSKKRDTFYPLTCSVTALIKDRYRGFKPVAIITLMTDKLKLKNSPIHYKAGFKPQKCKWKYYFVVQSDAKELLLEDRLAQVVFNKKNLSKNPSD